VRAPLHRPNSRTNQGCCLSSLAGSYQFTCISLCCLQAHLKPIVPHFVVGRAWVSWTSARCCISWRSWRDSCSFLGANSSVLGPFEVLSCANFQRSC
jgi:hypothetical protein